MCNLLLCYSILYEIHKNQYNLLFFAASYDSDVYHRNLSRGVCDLEI